MSLPTAVASGVESKPADEVVPVRPVRVGIASGVLAALYLVVLYLAHPVPDRFVGLVGGQPGELGRKGGIRLVWQPPAGYDLAKLGDQLARHGTQVTRQGDRAVIELGGVAPDEANAVVDGFTQRPLEFHEVIESDAMKSLVQTLALPMKNQSPVDADIDQWRPEEAGTVHVDYYLHARERIDLEKALTQARALGWQLPPQTHIAYEHVTGTVRGAVDYWRTYVVADEIGLDGTDIISATGVYDPNTNRPVVMVDMSRAGAQKFGELTARVVGRKLAIMTGDVVKSAPVINGAIGGGRAEITMGVGDPQQQERERDVLVKVLRAGPLPKGGTLISQEIVAPTITTVQLWLARLVLGLAGGALVGLFAWIVLRVTRPVRQGAPPAASGPWPASRIFVTLLAPIAVVAMSYVPVPTLDRDAFAELMGHPARDMLNLGSLGVAPLVSAYLIAELLAVTVWRKRRHAGAEARRPIRDAFIVLAILFTAVQAWALTTYLQSFSMQDLVPQTSQARLEVVAAFGVATGAFAALAAVIRRHGLGNGYGALIASGWLVLVIRGALVMPATASIVVLVQILAIAIPVVVVLRWRAYGAGEAMLRVPTSGIVPLAQSGGVLLVLATLAWIDIGDVKTKLFDLAGVMGGHSPLALAVGAALVIGWSAAFAWPRAIPAERAGLAKPSWATWTRATGLSLALLAAIVAARAPGTEPSLDTPVLIAIVTAFVLDALADLRARRSDLERVWTVHSAQRADIVERQLRDAGIACHLSSANLRTILGGFGACAPIDVLVPTAQSAAARALLS